MLNRDFILSKLSPYTNNKSVLIQNQTVGDIKKGLIQWHKKYQSEYDKIAPFFKGDSVEQSARNVYDFLKSNVRYNIESENEQTLRSPSAIIAPGRTVGADCKNYALFSAGVLDSISRNGDKKFSLSLRFASYDLFSSIPKHVFTVINPGTDHEIWVDPVLSYFNEKKEPTFYSDKKINDMSLIAMSGIGQKTMTDRQIYDSLVLEYKNGLSSGLIKNGSDLDYKYRQCINHYGEKFGKQKIGVIGIDDIAVGITIVKTLSNLFNAGGPNPDDWKGWNQLDNKIGAPAGTNAINWVINDGDSITNEAVNILSYINQYGINSIMGYSSWFKRNITVNMVADKLKRAGMVQQANDLLASAKILPVLKIDPVTGKEIKSGMNIFVTLGLVAGGILLISKMKK